MAIFKTNNDGEFDLTDEIKEFSKHLKFRRISEEDVFAMNRALKDNASNEPEWVVNAFDVYFAFRSFFRSWRGVSVEMAGQELSVGSSKTFVSLSVIANGVKAIDIDENSVIYECIKKSSYFQFPRDYASGIPGLRLGFDSDWDKNQASLKLDPYEFFDEVSSGDGWALLGELMSELEQEFPDIDSFFEQGSLADTVNDLVNEWCNNNNCALPSSYTTVMEYLCKFISIFTYGDSDYSPELSVLCNDGGIRINLRKCHIDFTDTKYLLSLLLRFVANIHIEREDKDYLCDISFDIPIRWQHSET